MTRPPLKRVGPAATFATLPPIARIGVVVVVALLAIVVLWKLTHHHNRYEKTADAITKAIAKNDMGPVIHAFNAVDRPELANRARVGKLSDLVTSMGAFKGSKEDTPSGSAPDYHHFTERFDKGTLEEKYTLDADGKIVKFHIGPVASP